MTKLSRWLRTRAGLRSSHGSSKSKITNLQVAVCIYKKIACTKSLELCMGYCNRRAMLCDVTCAQYIHSVYEQSIRNHQLHLQMHGSNPARSRTTPGRILECLHGLRSLWMTLAEWTNFSPLSICKQSILAWLDVHLSNLKDNGSSPRCIILT